MNTRTATELHEDHRRWWSMLCSWQADVKGYERRLQQLVAQGEGSDLMAEAEQYQNKLIREQEVIDELQHLVKTHETSLEQKARELPHVAATASYVDHTTLRERMDTAARLHVELRTSFRHWAAGQLHSSNVA